MVGFSSTHESRPARLCLGGACRSNKINGLALADAHAISCHEITFSNREDDDEAA
jgi:hypothetical protein